VGRGDLAGGPFVLLHRSNHRLLSIARSLVRDAENRAQFERGVGMALSALVSIPVLPIDRKQLATTIASATLGIGAQAATRFVEALLDQLSEPAGETTDGLMNGAA
jgi:hypothetical protein